MHRHKHLFEQVVSFGNLLAAAREALRGRRWRKPGASFYAELEKHLVDLHAELSGGYYCPGDYHYFKIFEPKERMVAAEPFRDRVVHHAIVRVRSAPFRAPFHRRFFCQPAGQGYARTHAARGAIRAAIRVCPQVRCPEILSQHRPRRADVAGRAGSG